MANEGIFTILIKNSTEGIREHAADVAKEAILGCLEALRDILVDLSFSIALVGGGVSILLAVSGLKRAKGWAGVCIVSHVLIKMVLG